MTFENADPGLSVEERAPFETLLLELSSRFIALPAGEVAREIREALRLVVEAFGTDRASFGEFSHDRTELTFFSSWARPGVPEVPPQHVVNERLAWWLGELRQGRPVVKGRLPDDLPPEAGSVKAFVTEEGIRAVATVPVFVGEGSIFVLSTGDFTRERTWTSRDVERLRLIGAILGNGLHRQRADEGLRARLAEIGDLKARLEHENLYLREEINREQEFGWAKEVIGQSIGLRAALSLVSEVAPTNAPVLLQGETGTGKELLARAIHDRSARRLRPMIKVDCTSVSASLIESELFGHEKGAFTGAVATRVGRFEVADGTTLFLDEIGEVPLELQSKLLRVLQEGEFQRVGSNRVIKIDVRVLAATNRDLAACCRSGTFRQDLYYRLNVFPITIPPLRTRREDIPLLVWGFINRRQDALGKRIGKVRRQDMAALQAYAWPGNIRELENVIERALILTRGDTLEVERAFGEGVVEAPSRRDSESLDAVEQTHIIRVLEQCRWRINGKGNAAEVLGLQPSTLRFRMKRLGIVRPPADRPANS